MNKSTNSAYRLYQILKKARNYSDNETILDVWSYVLGNKSNNSQDLLENFNNLTSLFSDVRKQLIKINIQN